MDHEHLAIASVPIQKWESILSAKDALKTGTIFQALDKPFFASEKISAPEQTDSGSANERENLMLKIQETSFMLDDARLFMDTHPDDRNGLDFLKSAVLLRKNLLKEFALKFYPLTIDCMADIYAQNPDSLCYCWQKGPVPWEGACV